MKVIAIAAALFAALVAAKKHHYCKCCVNGVADDTMTVGACGEWSASHPNSQYDNNMKACADPGRGRGIEGQPWEDSCRSYASSHNGPPAGQIQGCC